MRIIFGLLIVLLPVLTLAQKAISLLSPVSTIKSDIYTITSIVDSTSINNLGKVYNSGTTKGSLEFTFSTVKSFERYSQKLIKETDQRPVFVVVKKLVFQEHINDNYIVFGDLKIQLDFYTTYDGDSVLLYQSKGGSKYQRSVSYGYEENLAKILEQSVNSSFVSFNNYVEQNHLKLECFNKGSIIDIKPWRQETLPDTLFYHNTGITWNDFRAEPKSISKFAAAIFASFSLQTELQIENGFLKASIVPAVFMIPGMSWVKENAKNDYSLAHEQLHFDIAFYAAQRLINGLKKIEAETMIDLQSYVQYEYLEAFRYMNRLQEQYDEETGHGTNEAAQNKWQTIIANELTIIQSP